MRKIISIAVLLVVYLALSILIGNQFIISKSLPSIIAVLVAWLINRQISTVSVVTTLFVGAALFPLSFLIIALPVGDSLTDNVRVLIKNFSLSDAIQLFLPIVVGWVCAIAFVNASAWAKREEKS